MSNNKSLEEPIENLLVVRQSISEYLAREAVEVALTESGRLGFTTCIAVTDAAAHLVSFARMDGAPLLSLKLAQDKAYSAAIHGVATHLWWGLIHDEPGLVHGINQIDRLIIFGGGIPIIVGDALIGAIGVSGNSNSNQDRKIASLAAEHVVARISGRK